VQTTDAWQIKLVFNRYKSTVIELPPNWSTHRVWRHVHTHHPPLRHSRGAPTEQVRPGGMPLS
jgi:hypothetical protein